MKKKSIATLIIKTFFKAIGVMLLMLGVGVAGYFLTMLFYSVTSRTERCTQYTHVIDVNTGTDSRNLIYSFDEKSMLIDKIVLEIYHADTNNLDYVTIPSGTNIETSSETYMEMLKGSQEVPQIVRLSRLNKYFTGDVAYEYGIMALQDEIGTDIGYFTAISSAKFDEWFENRGTKAEPYYAPSKNILDQAKKCSDSYDLSELVEKNWDDLISDITCAQRKQYSAGFKKVNPELIHTYRLPTDKVRNTSTVIKDKSRDLFKKLDNNEEYTQTEDGKGISGTKSASKSMKKYKIQLTNASQINGLAASYKEKLEAAGYTVQGTGNYIGEVQTNSTIRVHKKGLAKDLLTYFKSAKEEVTTDGLTEGADIEVIIGSKDRITGY